MSREDSVDDPSGPVPATPGRTTGRHCYDWPRPAVTTDIAVFANRDGAPSILLIQRGGQPFAGSWALPGGFLDEDETLEACASRELQEETGLRAGPLRLFGTYSDPGRDPRGRTVTVAYWTTDAESGGEMRAGDDAAACRWFPLDGLPELAFDHDRIIRDAEAARGPEQDVRHRRTRNRNSTPAD